MQSVTTAVILAAGLGTRMLPATKSVPKEMLPIVDRPLVQYCVDEALEAGITEVVFVVAEGKGAIREHFEAGTRVERALRETGNQKAADELLAIGARATFHYVNQDRQLGIAHAVNCARSHLEGRPFALMFPDDLILGRSCVAELVSAHASVGGSVIAVEPVADADVPQYGIVDPIDETNPARLRRVVEKPALADAPSRLGIVGRYILSESIFEHIDRIPAGANGELQITDALAGQIEAGEPVSAFQFSGVRYDTGRPLGYLTASVAAALRRPELSEQVRSRLRALLAQGERSMRILSIGFPLPNMNVDNYNALTAPSYNDYDALVIDPASITKAAKDLAEEGTEYEAFDGRPILNAPTTASSVSATDQLRRRADETRRLLDAGGLVVVLARPDAVQGGLLGFEGLDRYHWLPAPGGLSWGPPYLKPAEGKTVRIAGAEGHPFATLLREFRKEVGYRAMFDERQAEVRRAGRVLATGGAGVPIAVEFPVLGGRVIFLPVMAESAYANRTELAEALVDACVRHAGSEFGANEPYWVRAQALPGLEQLEAELEESQASAAEAASHEQAVRERHDGLARHRRLLWEDGQPFAGAVVEALRLLGFAAEHTAGEPITLEHEGTRAFLEVESSRDQVVEWPYIRLQRRLEEHLLQKSESLKGIVIANGWREKDPEERDDELSAPLRIACENYRYTLLSTRSLFDLVKRTLGGAEDSTLLGIRRRIMQGAGLLTVEALLGEAAEESPSANSGPIF